jgi:DNA polymerase III alpha subunit
MKDLVRKLQPDCFDDIVALVALFRPGPLQSGMVEDFMARKHGYFPPAPPEPSSVVNRSSRRMPRDWCLWIQRRRRRCSCA